MELLNRRRCWLAARQRPSVARMEGTTDIQEKSCEDLAAAQRELQQALDDAGATLGHMCVRGEVSPAALRAIAATIRTLPSTALSD
ncbi:hypothetical protein IF188_06870 [Microbacterium sp. NEAU-LLC]|uniref:Uncharacterized protein n=1 Tax=Microbacterium helvum TaxID=2773713 RepID=A0ABR8NL71_9MICO|nr:hypothetical protein [Microbacterium helvum]MBD3941418.1 hypothetical protein [Microbacterium helvum]